MSTITSGISSSASNLYPQLGQTLIGLTSGAQPANLAEAVSDYDDSVGSSDSLTQQVAQQNAFSALADNAAATAATQTATGLISGSSASALASQANASADSVLALLQD